MRRTRDRPVNCETPFNEIRQTASRSLCSKTMRLRKIRNGVFRTAKTKPRSGVSSKSDFRSTNSNQRSQSLRRNQKQRRVSLWSMGQRGTPTARKHRRPRGTKMSFKSLCKSTSWLLREAVGRRGVRRQSQDLKASIRKCILRVRVRSNRFETNTCLKLSRK